MKITITGSLGHIGKPLVQDLIENGHNVTVISSNAEKQKEIKTLAFRARVILQELSAFLKTNY